MGRKAHYNRVKLQVPLDERVYASLAEQAKRLGFDSTQAYIRFWAKAETSGQAPSTYQDLTRPEVQALRYLELLLATCETPFESVPAALNYIVKQINRMTGLKYLHELLGFKHLNPF